MSAENPILILSAAWTEEWRMGIMNKNPRNFFIEHLPAALARSRTGDLRFDWVTPEQRPKRADVDDFLRSATPSR